MTTRLLMGFALTLALGAAHAQAPFPPPPPPTLIGPYVGGSVGYVTARKGCQGLLSGGGRGCDSTHATAARGSMRAWATIIS